MNTTPNYSLVPHRFWKRKDGVTGCPPRVSIYGSLPSPRESYEMAQEGYSVYDRKSNTYSNYFFGKIGIETEEEGLEIVTKLNNLWENKFASHES